MPLTGRRGKHQTLEPRSGLLRAGYLELALVDWYWLTSDLK